jgi:hypothetical protein
MLLDSPLVQFGNSLLENFVAAEGFSRGGDPGLARFLPRKVGVARREPSKYACGARIAGRLSDLQQLVRFSLEIVLTDHLFPFRTHA